MQITKLVIASILKPVTDTRMYEKFGVSISQTKKYEVNIIGFYSKKIPRHEYIKFHPIFLFKRISIRRFFAPLKFLLKIWQIKPATIIITTHELLLASCFYKLFHSVNLIYDIRENYYLNIKNTTAFPFVLKDIVATIVRLKESVLSPCINQFILAEKCYQDELPFIKNRFEIIENKAFQTIVHYKKSTNNIELLFTGTLADSTGIFECINLAIKLHEIEPCIRLNIIGHGKQPDTLKRIKKAIQNKSFIHLKGGANLVEHSEISTAISQADFGLIYYPKNIANDRSIPTKLYEYLAARLPIILEDKESFTSLTNPYSASINIDFSNYDSKDVLRQMKRSKFYKIQPKSELLWESEVSKLFDLI